MLLYIVLNVSASDSNKYYYYYYYYYTPNQTLASIYQSIFQKKVLITQHMLILRGAVPL